MWLFSLVLSYLSKYSPGFLVENAKKKTTKKKCISPWKCSRPNQFCKEVNLIKKVSIFKITRASAHAWSEKLLRLTVVVVQARLGKVNTMGPNFLPISNWIVWRLVEYHHFLILLCFFWASCLPCGFQYKNWKSGRNQVQNFLCAGCNLPQIPFVIILSSSCCPLVVLLLLCHLVIGSHISFELNTTAF